MTRILVTGFGAFPGAPANPTEAIVAALKRKYRPGLIRCGIDLRTAILPVSYGDIASAIAVLLELHQPQVIVHLGLAGQRNVISIETRARNRLSVVHPDALGAFNSSMDIAIGGTASSPARWPAARLVQAVKQSGCPAKPSIDAGDYLCNQALYISLSQHKGLCGFIHVPNPRKTRSSLSMRKPLRRPGVILPSLADLEHGVVAALHMLAAEHRHSAQG